MTDQTLFGKKLAELRDGISCKEKQGVSDLLQGIDESLFDGTNALERTMLEAIIEGEVDHFDGRISRHTLEYCEIETRISTSRNDYAEMITSKNSLARAVYSLLADSFEQRFFAIQSSITLKSSIDRVSTDFDEDYFALITTIKPPLTYELFYEIILQPNEHPPGTGWKGTVLSNYIDDVMKEFSETYRQGRDALIRSGKVVYLPYDTRQKQKLIPEGTSPQHKKSILMIHPVYVTQRDSVLLPYVVALVSHAVENDGRRVVGRKIMDTAKELFHRADDATTRWDSLYDVDVGFGKYKLALDALDAVATLDINVTVEKSVILNRLYSCAQDILRKIEAPSFSDQTERDLEHSGFILSLLEKHDTQLYEKQRDAMKISTDAMEELAKTTSTSSFIAYLRKVMR